MDSHGCISFSFFFLLLLLLPFHSSRADDVPAPRNHHGLTIIKDTTVNQYYTVFIIGQPPVAFALILDLGNLYSWAACDALNYKSTSFRPIPCSSTVCSAYGGGGCVGCDAEPSPSCTNYTCGAYAYTHWSKGLYSYGLIQDEIFLYTRPKNSFKVLQYSMPGFPFGCLSGEGHVKGMSPSAKGILTLANANIAFHSVISKTFGVPRKFALCLPTTDTILYKGFQGALYMGGGPYYMSKGSQRDFSKSLTTTPLVVNPVSTAPISSEGDTSVEYFINVTSIKVGGHPLKIDSLLLNINKNGVGGIKFSTVEPYTVLHRTIYKMVVKEFTAKAKAMNIPRVGAVPPFGACYDSRYMANSTSGPKVPTLDLVLHEPNAKWRFYGANLMVKFMDIKYRNVLCLGFVDGGIKTRTSIVIGGKQMEDNIVEFDVDSMKVGVTSEPVRLGLSCSQFQSTLPTF